MDPEALSTVERVPHGGTDDFGVVDFSTNVNPDRPDGVGRTYETALCAARSYPANDYCEYRIAAGEYVGCEPADVVPTPGGLGAIRLAVAVTVDRGDRVLLPFPSSGEYRREVELQGGRPEFVHYADLPDCDPTSYALAVLCHPNNPTGDAYETDRLVRFAEECRRSDTTLLVDEGFLGFTDRPTMAGQDGVVVARSLTKLFGLPGLRAGFAVATGDLGDRLSAARRTWTLGTPACEVGTFCMRQTEFVERTRERVRLERERMRAELATRFDVHESDAPFLLLDVGAQSVDAVVDRARRRDIIVRDARTFRGLDNHIRVAVRRESQNDALLSALLDA